jgi:hypothetical protein
MSYFEFGGLGFSKNASVPNRAMERMASHQGWKTIGKRMKKTMKITHRHVGTSVIYAALSALRCLSASQGATKA